MSNYSLSISDLELEVWLRRRNNGSLVWRTAKGERIPLKDMSDEHLLRALARMEREYQQEFDL